MLLSRNIFALFFIALFSFSIDAADDQYKLSDARIDTIHSIIARSVADREDLSNAAVIQAIYDKIAAEMPLTPSVPIVQVDLKKLNEEARLKTEEKFKVSPEKLRKKYAAEAQKKYPMNKLKDQVTITYKRGTVSGTLYRITSTNVLINSTTVSFIDMDKLTRSRFDSRCNKTMQEQYVQERVNTYMNGFAREQQKIFEKLLEQANGENEKNGYIYVKRSEKWRTAKNIASENLDIEIEQYKKMKEKQERIRRKREAKELAAREAREKAAADSAAREAEQERERQQREEAASKRAAMTQNSMTMPSSPYADPAKQQSVNNPFGMPEAKTGNGVREQNSRDMFGSETQNNLPVDDGGDFIALSAEQLAALSRPFVNEESYKKLMGDIEKKQNEISNVYYGIDADQGFKKALWGFSETDVYYALSKETDAIFIKKVKINRNDILYPEGSRPQKIYLHYHLGELYKVEIFVGELGEKEFNVMKNSLRQKYGKSDTQKKIGDDIFDRIIAGNASPDDLPEIKEAGVDETGVEPDTPKGSSSDGENSEDTDGAAAAKKPYLFVWDGVLSQGILSFYYDKETQTYEDVIFKKTYLPLRLKKYQKKKAETEAARNQKKTSEAKTGAEAETPAAPEVKKAN